MNDKRTKVIQIRVSEEEKAKIEDITKSVGTDVSTFLRKVALKNDKVILLEEGPTIAKELYELVCTIKSAENSDKIEGVYVAAFLSKVEALISAFNKLTEKLTDISDSEIDENDKTVEDE